MWHEHETDDSRNLTRDTGRSDEYGINTEVMLAGRKLHESNKVLNELRNLLQIREAYIELSDITRVS